MGLDYIARNLKILDGIGWDQMGLDVFKWNHKIALNFSNYVIFSIIPSCVVVSSMIIYLISEICNAYNLT